MIRVIATLSKDGSNTIGYRIFVDKKLTQAIASTYSVSFKGNIADLTTLQAIKAIQQFGSVNGSIEGGRLTVTDGSVNSLPVVNPITGACLRNNVFIVLNELTYNNETVGYTVCNYTGMTAQLKTGDLIAKRTNFANAKIVTRGDKTFISAIKGVFASFPLKPKTTNRVVEKQQTNYATLVSTTKKYGSCSIRAMAKSKGLIGVVSLSEENQVIFRTKDQYGDVRTYIIPQKDFNTRFELDSIVLPSNQYQEKSHEIPKTKQTNAQVLHTLHKQGVKAIPVTEIEEGRPTGIKGYLRYANGQYQFQQIFNTHKTVINVSELYVNTKLHLHTKPTNQQSQQHQQKPKVTQAK